MDTITTITESARTDDPFARDLRGFGPLGILAILVIHAGNLIVAPLSAVLVLVWARMSRTPWRDIGYVKPDSWIRSLAVGVAFGIALKLLMKAIVMPLLGAPPINQAYHYLAGNQAALPGAVFTMVVVAGFGEETVFRGYLFERLRRLFGRRLARRHQLSSSLRSGSGCSTITIRGSPAPSRPRSSG